MKTSKQWYESVIDDDLRGKLLTNLLDKNKDEPCETLDKALFSGFNWSPTSEGFSYWNGIAYNAATNAIPMNNTK